jgi:cell division protein FtsX
MTIGSFLLGLIILVVGVVFMKFHRQVADSFGVGGVDYDRYKMAALIVCGVGIAIMTGIHLLLLQFIVGLFPRL